MDTYAVIVFDRWEEDEISFVAGPFKSLEEAHKWQHEFEERHEEYRSSYVAKLRLEEPEWEWDFS